jgi:sulfur carrier protein ThiS
VKIHLGGHLNFYDAEKRAWLEMHTPKPISIDELRAILGLPGGEIMLVAVNGTVIESLDTLVSDEDRVEFYSPIGGGA